VSASEIVYTESRSGVRSAPVCVLIVVRGVEGSCSKHLTVEFYKIVMLLTFILIPSPLTLSFQA